MAEWKTPVFDRTMDDVKSVDRTSAVYQKGTLNADDLNRIEDNYKYLMAKLKSNAIFIPHRLRSFTETVLEYVQVGEEAPEYTIVEYIQSGGGQYIDTGVQLVSGLSAVIDYQPTSTESDDWFFSVLNTSGTTGWRAGVYQNSFYLINFTASQSSNLTARTTFSGTSTNTESLNIFIFAENRNGSMYGNASGKLYSCKIYDANGVLIRDYIPCKNESGSVGLYDLANGEFYENKGTGAFTPGPEVPVETDPIYELVETTTTYTDWHKHNLPWLSEINRIRANHSALVRLFLVGLGLSEQKESNYLDYIEVNNWEKIALAGKTIFENMEKEYRFCGVEVSGGDRLL